MCREWTACLLIGVSALLATPDVARAKRQPPQPSPSTVACGPLATDTTDMQTVATWISLLQYTNATLPSFGAVKVHHTPAYAAPNGDQYFRVVPYRTNLGLLGLLQAPVAGKLHATEIWINWYLRHLNLSGTPPGVVYDHWYLADGTGETTCPPGIAASLCNFDDASDSCAGTFLGLAWAYYQAGGSQAGTFLAAPGNKAKFETIAAVMLALQQADGLDWAKTDYHVKYGMDNSEVYWGLSSMSQLEAVVFGDPTASQMYANAASRVQKGILNALYNAKTGLFRVAELEDGSVDEADLNVWYPGTVAVVWPHLFGVTPGSSKIALAQMAAVDASWGGSPHPDWTTNIVDPDGFVWPAVGYAAWLTGDCARARAHTNFVKQLKFPTSASDIGFAWPFTVDDAGWMILTLSKLSQG